MRSASFGRRSLPPFLFPREVAETENDGGRIAALREKANALPLLPGVYIMKDAHGEVIYVGKAKALKNRVTSYFRGEHLPKVAAMVAKVEDFDVIVVNSEFEALVLENSLIKRHRPHHPWGFTARSQPAHGRPPFPDGCGPHRRCSLPAAW